MNAEIFKEEQPFAKKKTTMLSQSRLTATANPFVIYHFFRAFGQSSDKLKFWTTPNLECRRNQVSSHPQ